MDKSNKIENLANKYVERHIRDRHLSDDTIKEIKIAYIMIIKDFIVPACGVGAPHKRYRVWFIASDCSDARVEGLRQGREDKIHGFEFTSQTRDKIRRLITDTSGLRSHRFLYDKEDDKKQRSTENRFFKKYACRDWDGRGSTQWKSFPTQSPICRGNDGLPFNVDNLTIPYGK